MVFIKKMPGKRMKMFAGLFKLWRKRNYYRIYLELNTGK